MAIVKYRDLIPLDECSMCAITSYHVDKKFIEVDHINTDHTNNNFSNLWALCRYCHNIKSRYENQLKVDYFWILYIISGRHQEVSKILTELSLNYFKSNILNPNFDRKHELILKKFQKEIISLSEDDKKIISEKKKEFFEILEKKDNGEIKPRKQKPNFNKKERDMNEIEQRSNLLFLKNSNIKRHNLNAKYKKPLYIDSRLEKLWKLYDIPIDPNYPKNGIDLFDDATPWFYD